MTIDAEAILDNAGSKVINIIGRSATYTPSVGGAVSLKVHLEKDVDLEPLGFAGRIHGTMTTVEALLEDLGKEPIQGETFLIGSTTYTVQFPVENDGRFVKVAVK